MGRLKLDDPEENGEVEVVVCDQCGKLFSASDETIYPRQERSEDENGRTVLLQQEICTSCAAYLVALWLQNGKEEWYLAHPEELLAEWTKERTDPDPE